MVLVGFAGNTPEKRSFSEVPNGILFMVKSRLVLAALVVGAGILLAYSCRRVLLWRNAVAPGPILVRSLEDATAAGDVPVRDLSIQFQHGLSRLRLPASEVPGGTPSIEFIELLSQTEFDVKKPLGFFAGILRVIVPSHSYEVAVTLLDGPTEPRCGVVVEMVMLPGRITTFHRYWEETWERAIERAAHGVAAQVLPRTRLCDDPWKAWRRGALPEMLFDEYQQARQMLQERRFEESLGHYYSALRLDPGNHEIGYELGVAQEKLALWLDALLTYHRVFCPPRHRRQRVRLEALPGRRITRRADLIARYRFCALLGSGERLARQWITTGSRGGASQARGRQQPYAVRDSERTSVRWQLRTILSERFDSLDEDALGTLGITVPDGLAEVARRKILRDRLKRALADPTPGGGRRQEARREQESELRLLFVVFAEHEARMLLHDTRYQRFLLMNSSLTRTSLQISAALATRRRARVAGIPFDVDGADDTALYARIFGSRLATRLQRSQSYTDHYDAACAFAIPLLTVGRRSGRTASAKDRQRLTALAVRELHLATDCADGEVMALRWDWIVGEDPDLAGLRKTHEFRAFEATRLPSPRSPPLRPSDVQQLELAMHAAQMIAVVARRFAAEWLRRARHAAEGSTVEVQQIRAWMDEERESWEALAQLAIDHRDWRTRLDWLVRSQRLARRHAQEPLAIQHPVYGDAPIKPDELSGGASQMDDTAIKRVKAADTRMRRLQDVLDDKMELLCDRVALGSWRESLGDLEAGGFTMPAGQLARLCHGRGSLWVGVAGWFEMTVESNGAVETAAEALNSALAGMPMPGRLARTTHSVPRGV